MQAVTPAQVGWPLEVMSPALKYGDLLQCACCMRPCIAVNEADECLCRRLCGTVQILQQANAHGEEQHSAQELPSAAAVATYPGQTSPFHDTCGRDSREFSSKLEQALRSEPVPMTPELQRRLTWEEATERFIDVAELKAAERPGVLETAVDKLAWAAHNTLTGAPFFLVTTMCLHTICQLLQVGLCCMRLLSALSVCLPEELCTQWSIAADLYARPEPRTADGNPSSPRPFAFSLRHVCKHP